MSCCDWLLLHDDLCLSSRCIVPACRERGPSLCVSLCASLLFLLAENVFLILMSQHHDFLWTRTHGHGSHSYFPTSSVPTSCSVNMNFLSKLKLTFCCFYATKQATLKNTWNRTDSCCCSREKSLTMNSWLINRILIAIDFWCCCCRGGVQSSD